MPSESDTSPGPASDPGRCRGDGLHAHRWTRVGCRGDETGTSENWRGAFANQIANAQVSGSWFRVKTYRRHSLDDVAAEDAARKAKKGIGSGEFEGPIMELPAMIESISAVTLATHDMARAVRFYRALGFQIASGGERASFTSFEAGSSFLNLIAQPKDRQWSWWGRAIFHVTDVDVLYRRAIASGIHPDAAPRDAEWGERFFHVTDPDGHELSFARALGVAPR